MCLLAAGCDNPDDTPEAGSGTHDPSPPASAVEEPRSPLAMLPSAAAHSSAPSGANRGQGTFGRIASGGTDIVGSAGTVVTYCVRVEDGITSFEPDGVAAVVDAALADNRSWIAGKRWRFQRLSHCENVRLKVNLATPPTVDRNCAGAAQTVGQWSCFNNRAVFINLTRWTVGVVHAGGDLPGYRVMVVNHEVGHSLGFSHVTCPGAGKTAPIMLPQSRGLNGCVFNPYPYPDGVNYVG